MTPRMWCRSLICARLKFFGGFHGENARPWLLAIVRNTCYTWLRRNRMEEPTTDLDEGTQLIGSDRPNPESLLLAAARTELLRARPGEPGPRIS